MRGDGAMSRRARTAICRCRAGVCCAAGGAERGGGSAEEIDGCGGGICSPMLPGGSKRICVHAQGRRVGVDDGGGAFEFALAWIGERGGGGGRGEVSGGDVDQRSDAV